MIGLLGVDLRTGWCHLGDRTAVAALTVLVRRGVDSRHQQGRPAPTIEEYHMPDKPDYVSENAPDVALEHDDVEGHRVLRDQAPGFASDQAPGFASGQAARMVRADDDDDDVEGHRVLRDQAPGFASDQAPGVRTYPKATDDDGDDVSGHVYIESKDDSGTRRDH
jgi:hypothetical protein